jgi:BirA family biotin operon repressor/biotin-[acetyl-CoA-carboxylase] ligase
MMPHDDLPQDFAEAIDRVQSRLGALGSSVLFFHSIGSTNDVAASLAQTGNAEGAVVVADAQTSGRGRRGRTWFSPPGSGLYVSVVLAPGRARAAPERAMMLTTIAAGVALAEGIELVTGLAADIKWPNDLLVGRRKLAGILAEAIGAGGAATREQPNGSVVLGYGINVRHAAFPPELGDRATALESELGRAIDRASLFAETLVALNRRYGDLLEGRFDAILDAWRARARGHRGARVSWDAGGTRSSGITAGIDDRGALLVQVGERVERIVAGEISWL